MFIKIKKKFKKILQNFRNCCRKIAEENQYAEAENLLDCEKADYCTVNTGMTCQKPADIIYAEYDHNIAVEPHQHIHYSRLDTDELFNELYQTLDKAQKTDDSLRNNIENNSPLLNPRLELIASTLNRSAQRVIEVGRQLDVDEYEYCV